MKTRKLTPEALDALRLCREVLEHRSTIGPSTKALPEHLPNGDEITTVAQFAAMNNLSIKTAATYLLNTENASMPLIVDAKRLQGPPADDRGGVCIFLQPGMASAEGITQQVETTMAPEELHVTLAYFGMLGQVPEWMTFSKVLAWAEIIAAQHEPFFARLNGISRFNGTEQDAVVLNVDAAPTEDIRKTAMDIFGNHVNRLHGYTPHMTIGYLNPDDDLHIQRTPPIDDVYIEYVTVAYGGQYVRVKLSKPKEQSLHTVRAPQEKSAPRKKNRNRGFKP